ncbi:FAD-dependent monooxygenase [Inmirania thermothiophila]|uniref:2-octaprenyl-6-methoxyphenol hydroxylase n=1 Tax=Inmirania thermothiophila TaxID=1750597 RepID=A0A3N1Y5R8_9GAMM|nr:FAD-dependent monooxygenase [Inmirania thermothiophila]ROR34155.1 2-octaprenyl-6-methoxyphenol hydroxylase [Inmirania thermothiophila]
MEQGTQVLVAGDGPAGGALALALARRGVAVALAGPGRHHGPRPLALSRAAVRLLARLDVWAPAAATPLQAVRLAAGGWSSRIGEGAPLGAVVRADTLAGLLDAALERAGVERLRAPVRRLRRGPDGVEAEVGGARVRARLVVGADGADSTVRALAGIGTREADYGQSALVTLLAPRRPHDGVVEERFTPRGPLVLLPCGEALGLVWLLPREAARNLAGSDPAALAAALAAAAGEPPGRPLAPAQAVPLRLVRARTLVHHRLALAGGAACTLHPLGAQGLNLGLRDVAALAPLVAEAVATGGDPGGWPVLEAYARARREDHRRTAAFTDLAARALAGGSPLRPLAARLAALLGWVPPLRRAVLAHGGGEAAYQPDPEAV